MAVQFSFTVYVCVCMICIEIYTVLVYFLEKQRVEGGFKFLNEEIFRSFKQVFYTRTVSTYSPLESPRLA